MKKQLILALFFLLGALALPASAQGYRHHSGYSEVFISGYRSCGTPVYAKRVWCGHHYRVVPLVGHELRCYLERRERLAAQREREWQRRLAYERYLRARAHHHHSRGIYRGSVSGGRCR